MALYALDEASDFLALALEHATTSQERAAACDELARSAELSGRWADVERWCEVMLSSDALLADPVRALGVRQRRLQARVRLGQHARETEEECLALLAVAEQRGTRSDVVSIRSLLVQTIARSGRTAEAIAIAEESVRLAEESGDEAMSAEALHRLAITLNDTRPHDAVELLLRLVARARARGDRGMEARGFLSLGVARTRTRDDRAGADAFRTALIIAREAQALDIAASASMNLGVLELRRGEFSAAHDACTEALRLYTTLRNNANRLVALYNLANLERDRGDAGAAAALYRETAELAEQVGAADIAIGARAGAGLTALRLNDMPTARLALAAANLLLGNRDEWWFQGRELLESLSIRLAMLGGDPEGARARFHHAVGRLEALESYPATWLVADCAADLVARRAGNDHGAGTADESAQGAVWRTVERLSALPATQASPPLRARFTALRDLSDRPSPVVRGGVPG